jgi:hypothetical protein
VIWKALRPHVYSMGGAIVSQLVVIQLIFWWKPSWGLFIALLLACLSFLLPLYIYCWILSEMWEEAYETE